MFEEYIGLSSEPVENVVERGAARKFAEAIEDPNPVYMGAAKESLHGRLHGRLIAPRPSLAPSIMEPSRLVM